MRPEAAVSSAVMEYGTVSVMAHGNPSAANNTRAPTLRRPCAPILRITSVKTKAKHRRKSANAHTFFDPSVRHNGLIIKELTPDTTEFRSRPSAPLVTPR